MDGGMTIAIELDDAMRASEKDGEKPDAIIAGIRTAPRAATVAGPDPEIAPKKQETMTQQIAMPPLLWPTRLSMNRTSLPEMPAFAMIFPDRTKNGIARRRNLPIPVYVLVAIMLSVRFEYSDVKCDAQKIAAAELAPRQIAIGTPIASITKNVINRTAVIMPSPPFRPPYL